MAASNAPFCSAAGMLGTASSLKSTSALDRPTCARPLSRTIAPPPAMIGTATLRPFKSFMLRT